MSTTHSPRFIQRRRLLMFLPVAILPFLFGVFRVLGGGKGIAPDEAKRAAGMGFNMELPKPLFTKKENSMDKMAFYKKADEDSVRRKEYIERDPYHARVTSPSPIMVSAAVPVSMPDAAVQGEAKADELLKKLEGLKRSMEQAKMASVRAPLGGMPVSVPMTAPEIRRLPPARMPVDTPERDPQL
jgi:hypothetical protein